jgi:hypothetical protein
MNSVQICRDTFNPNSWVTVTGVDNVPQFIFDEFEGEKPDGLHVYHNFVSQRHDVTPFDERSVEELTKLKGHFIVIVYPEGLETILLIVAIALAAVSIGLGFLLRPSLPEKQSSSSSANNHLSDRQNEARPNQRIPDIFGQVWATFDLLMFPYRTFVSNVEIEHCYMCIGRGEYDFAIGDIRDDTTPLNTIPGVQAAIYGPNTSPNSGSPIATINSAPAEALVNIKPSSTVNGQTLSSPNAQYKGDGTNIRFKSPNIIENNGSFDMTDYFQAGGFVQVGGYRTNDDVARDPGHTLSSLHMAGVYPVSSVSATQLVLGGTPSAVNANWGAPLSAFAGGTSDFLLDPSDSTQITLTNTDSIGGLSVTNTTGPFAVINKTMTQIWLNFVSPQGLYAMDKKGNQHPVRATIQITIQQCDATGTPIGSPSAAFASVTITGSSVNRQQVGVTLKVVLPANYAINGGVLVTARRSTKTGQYLSNIVSGTLNSDGDAQYIEDIQWRDMYMVSPVTQLNFGNVTTIQTIVSPTPQALSVKERKMNGLVTRKVPDFNTGINTASKNVADIIFAVALDPYIGGRTTAEIDLVGINNLLKIGGTVQNYFAVYPNVTAPIEFCYTFDDSKISFEETIAQIAQACFCTPYRLGNVLKMSFEKKTANSVLLFNHRNKIPGSETRTFTFGTNSENDGIDLDYIEPNAANFPNQDTTVTLHFPTNGTAKNPKKITAVGVRNVDQALLLGWRLYKKMTMQNLSVQFDATQETALLVQNDRILVADNTRSDIQDGEVLAQASLVLTLSQKPVFTAGLTYTIFLQHPDATVESIAITAGPLANQVTLGTAPSQACVIDPTYFAKTTYMIVSNVAGQATAFLLVEKNPKDGQTYEVKAVNYDDGYYVHDGDITTDIQVGQVIVEVVT